MKKLLLVEDSSLVLKVLKRLVHLNAEFEADFAESYQEAIKFIGDKPEKYFAAVVDLNLPDAPKGEIVDYVLERDIPTIVLTASFNESKREALIKKGVVDYVIKESRFSYESAIKIMSRLSKNHNIKIMVVDDSSVARKQCSRLLEKYLFNVVEANGAKEAIHQLVNQPDIKLVITDYNMPEVDGFELVKLIRTKYDKNNLTIIGLSGDGDETLSARFIKNGANDFLKKPFVQEEFYCRVMNSIETLESIEQIKESAKKDYLTQLNNRQYFFQLAEENISRAQQTSSNYFIAIIELDDFDEFDNLQHNYGDDAVLQFSQLFSQEFSAMLTGRLSSRQFVLFADDQKGRLSDQKLFELLDNFREKVRRLNIFQEAIDDEDNESLYLSISASFSESRSDGLIPLLESCEALLVRAKEAGNDIVVFDSPE